TTTFRAIWPNNRHVHGPFMTHTANARQRENRILGGHPNAGSSSHVRGRVRATGHVIHDRSAGRLGWRRKAMEFEDSIEVCRFSSSSDVLEPIRAGAELVEQVGDDP